MKQKRTGIYRYFFSWIVVYAVAFAPLRARADEAANDNYNPRHVPVVIQPKNSAITVVKATEIKPDEAKNLQAAEPTQIYDSELKDNVPLNAYFKGNSTEEERRATSPKSLLRRQAEFAAKVPVAAGKTILASPKLTAETAVHFPAEATTFYTAMGVLAVAELNAPGSDSANNPAVLDQFIDNSFKDPIGAMGFFGFMLVSAHAQNFFEQLAVSGTEETAASNFAAAKLLFRGLLIGQVAMSAGFLAQTAFTEIYHDKEAQMCLGRWGVKKIQKLVNGKLVNLKPDSPEILDACETAYERWTLGQKLKDYTPQVLSMAAVVVAQSVGIPLAGWLLKTEAGEALTGALLRTRGIGMILEGVTMTWKVGRNFIWPQGKLVAKVASMIFFLKGSQMIQPWFDKHVGSEFKAHDLADVTNQFEEKLAGASHNNWQEVQYTDIDDKHRNDPVELLKKVSLHYQNFRQHELQKGHEDYANWTQALLKFQSSYISSYAVYDSLISDIKKFRERGNNNRYSGKTPPALFLSRESPIYRVGTLIPKNLAQYRIGKDPLTDLLQRVRNYYLAKQKSLTQQQNLILRNINFGLEMAYRDLSPAELDAAIKKANLNSGSLSQEQRDSIAVEIRAKRVDNALKLFKQVGHQLQSNSLAGLKTEVKGVIADLFQSNYNNMNFNEFMSHTYADLNDWVDVAVTVAGYDYYHHELTGNPQVITAAAMKAVPNHYEKAFTPNMSDYLLASMVCGPKSQGGAQAKEKQTSMLSKALNWFNFNNENKSTFQNLSLIQYTPGFGFEFLPPRLVDDKIADANLCGTTPNRAKIQNILTAAGEVLNGISAEKQNLSIMPYFNVNTGEHKVNNETHYGFLPLVKYYLNPKFLAKPSGNSSAFYQAWESEVEPQVKTAILGFEKMYRDLVMKDFVPTFTSGEIKIHENRKVHYGTGWSLHEEGTYYSDLLKRMVPGPEMEQQLKTYNHNLDLSIAMFSQKERVAQASQIILSTMKDTSKTQANDNNSSDDPMSQLSTVDQATSFTRQEIAAVRNAADPAAQAAMTLLLKNIESNIKSIKDLIANKNMIGTAKTVADQLAKNMEQVTGEAGSYYGVIKAATLQGLPEVSDIR